MTKVLIIHNNYKTIGGEDVAVDNEINLLKEHFEVETLFYNNHIENYLTQFLYFITNNNKRSTKLLNNKIKEFKPDVAYVHNTWFKASLGIFKTLSKNKVKTYVKLHNFRYECTRYFLVKNHLRGGEYCTMCGLKNKKFQIFNTYFQDSFLKSLLVVWYGKRYFKVLKSDDLGILVLTNFHKNFLLSLGFDSQNISILFNPVDNKNRFTIRKNYDYFTYSGRISLEKGVKELIQAFLKSDIKQNILKIVGEGPLLQSLKKEFELHQNIEFVGLVSNKESKKIISNSKAVITATKLLEGQPMLLCEASSYAVPGIFPLQGGIEEFYPKDTRLSFHNSIESNLVNVLNKLAENEFLKQEGSKSKKYIEENYNDYLYIQNFQKIILEIE